MSLKVAVGYSDDLEEPREAGIEAAEAALEKMGDIVPKVAVVFASIDFDQSALLDGLKEKLGHIPMIGCTTDGEINTEGTFRDSISLMLMGGSSIDPTVELASELSSNPEESARAVARRLCHGNKSPAKLAICLPDSSTTGNITSVLEGLKAELGATFPVFGGLPGDNQRLTGTTYQYFNWKRYTDSMPVLALSGAFTFQSEISSDVHPLGAKAVCTRVQDNVILEIDGQPAIEHHRRYLGDEVMVPATVANFPYLLESGQGLDGEELYLVRTPFFYIPENGAISCAAPIPEGSTIRIGRCTRERILDGAEAAAARLKDSLDSTCPQALFVFSCSGRKQQLGIEVEQEMERISHVFGGEIPTLGFYCYGELGPVKRRGGTHSSEYHGYTVSMLTLAG